MSLSSLLKNSIEKYADCPAITDQNGDRTMTYRELNSLSGKTASKLAAHGIKEGSVVMVNMGRCTEYFAAELAAIRIGAAVIPVIPDYPAKRVEYICKDADVSYIIEDSFFDDVETYSEVPWTDFAEDTKVMMVYTSGSIGNPKGVIYREKAFRAAVNRKTSFKFDPHMNYAASGALSFIVIVCEYFQTLTSGTHIHMLSDEVRGDINRMQEYYVKHHINAGFISPRMLKSFSCKSEDLKIVLTGSEKVVNLYSEDFTIISLYGQTETAGPISSFSIDKPYPNTPVGKPYSGIEIRIIDDDGNEVENGEEGEIAIIGDLAYEYNNLSEQTAETFDHLEDGRILIHSGDIGKKDSNGNVIYLNRKDWMLKIHGQRVEPGEIESCMRQTDGLTDAAVKSFEQEDGTMLLCGFYTSQKAVSADEIKKTILKRLPHYMVPNVFVHMDKFPTNVNGKLDRKSLKKPDINQLLGEYEKPVGKTEEAICAAMEKILGAERIGRKDDFFSLGGNSLNSIMLAEECHLSGMSPQFIMMGKTAQEIAKLYEESKQNQKPPMHKGGKLRDRYPMTLSQRYQMDVTGSVGRTIDEMDFPFYTKLDASVDMERLEKAIIKAVNDHPIYKVRIDNAKEEMFFDGTEFSIKHTTVSAEDFKKYRSEKSVRVRDLSKDPLLYAEIIRVDNGETYLYFNFCHMIYDGIGIGCFIDYVSKCYNEPDRYAENESDETFSIFDLCDYEQDLKETPFYKEAWNYFDQYYEGTAHFTFPENESQNTVCNQDILTDVEENNISRFLVENRISILTLLQGTLEAAVGEYFQTDNFSYMTVYDGRFEPGLRDTHGVLAKAIFLKSSLEKQDDREEFLASIQNSYQKNTYYDVVNIPELIQKHPAIKSGITFNYRTPWDYVLKLGDGVYPLNSEFIFEHLAMKTQFSAMDFQIGPASSGKGYNINLLSTKLGMEEAAKFIDVYEKALRKILAM